MRWFAATLYELKETGHDKTGKPTTEPTECGSIFVRVTPWASNETIVDGNTFDSVPRTFVTRKDRSSLESVSMIKVAGETYEVLGLASADFETIITARRCKP